MPPDRVESQPISHPIGAVSDEYVRWNLPQRCLSEKSLANREGILPGINVSNEAASLAPTVVGTSSSEKDIEGQARSQEDASQLGTNGNANLIEWDGPDDPENPQNFSVWKKWIITLSLSTMTVWVTFATSVFSTATVATAEEFHIGSEIMLFSTTLPMCGFAVGPLVWGPLSELYGRRLPIFLGYTLFAIFQIPVALAQNVQTVLIARFFVGFFGCSALAVSGGAMADYWGPVDRGVAVATFASATFGGPVLGPILGGFITQSRLGWRWTAWITLIASALFGSICFIIVPETYHPILLQRRAAGLRKSTQNWAIHSRLDEAPPSMQEIGSKYIFRPLRMLFLEPILTCITIYLSFIYAILYLFFEAYPISFGEIRGWKNQGVAALPFLGILVGVLCGAALIIYITKTSFARNLKARGKVVPEERLVPMMIASILLPIGLFWFGWTSHPSTSWVLQALAGIPMGAGILVIFMQGLNYIIDVYMMFANSALAANTLARSLLAGGFPLFATQMYHKLGVDWASSLLAFLTVGMVPIPFMLYRYGSKLRDMSRFRPEL
ncbi:hypothetical protein ZTR_09726 [Talaromyces verruculosus]|nr:hypothetical protein ZTR_09726 [Talaromyces verruculosus]